MAQTDIPCIVQMQQMMRGKKDILSLAQGIVHWEPPESALAAGRTAMLDSKSNLYGADDGLEELRNAIKHKLRTEKGMTNSEVMITAGANQAEALQRKVLPRDPQDVRRVRDADDEEDDPEHGRAQQADARARRATAGGGRRRWYIQRQPARSTDVICRPHIGRHARGWNVLDVVDADTLHASLHHSLRESASTERTERCRATRPLR